MKQRERARLLKQRLSRRVQDYDTEEELFAAVRERLRRARAKQAKLTNDEEALLNGITSSRQFTLANVVSMYAGVKRLRGTD
jgi:hypothetical protein